MLAPWQHRVTILNVRIRMERDRGRLELAVDRPFVQRLDVAEHVLELEPARIDPLGGERPEHERIVWIRAMPKPNPHRARLTGSTRMTVQLGLALSSRGGVERPRRTGRHGLQATP